MNKGIEAETAGTPGALTRSLARDLDEEDHKMLLPSGDKRGGAAEDGGEGTHPRGGQQDLGWEMGRGKRSPALKPQFPHLKSRNASTYLLRVTF